MLRLAFDFIITWRETRTRPNAYPSPKWYKLITRVIRFHHFSETINLSGSNWMHNKEDKGYAPRKDS